MAWIENVLAFLAEPLRDYLSSITLAIAATILILYGNDVNRFVKRKISARPFILRLLIFMALCAFGYAVVTLIIGATLAQLLVGLSNGALILTVLIILTVIGFLAERKGQM